MLLCWGITLVGAPSASAATYLEKRSICSNVFNLGAESQWEQYIDYVRSSDAQGRSVIRIDGGISVGNQTGRGVIIDSIEFNATNHPSTSSGYWTYAFSGRTLAGTDDAYRLSFVSYGTADPLTNPISSRKMVHGNDGRIATTYAPGYGVATEYWSNRWNTAGNDPFYNFWVPVSYNPGITVGFTAITSGAKFKCRTTLS